MPTQISFTLDNLGDAADLYRGNIAEPRPSGSNYALEVGVPSLLEMFRRHQIPLTYFVEGWSAERYPAIVRDIAGMGHAIGMHGWQHEIWELLSPEEAEALAIRATQSIEQALGYAPQAFRAPGGKSTAHTQTVLARLGYQIDASFAERAGPSSALGELVNLPYQWTAVDATHWLWHKRSPQDALQHWSNALENAAATNTPFVFIFHSHVMGMQPERLTIGEAVIQQVRADPRFEIVPLAAIRTQFLSA
jgi:peptidoglycan/xylan/chitin deacetylase (PgdA/CDA1 family)